MRLITITILLVVVGAVTLSFGRIEEPVEDIVIPPPLEIIKEKEKEKEKPEPLTIPELITELSIEYGVDVNQALAIAECESTFNPKARNPNSSAKGIYQFIDGTWNNYCEGDVFNPTDNITCFLKYYPKYPRWWSECLWVLK